MAASIGRIVVGLDGTPGGRAALVFALRDAARRGAMVEVVTAFDTAETVAALCGTTATAVGTTTAELRDAVRQEALGVVDETQDRLADEFDRPPPVTITTIGGDATAALLDSATGADLLVVGSRGRGRFASTVLGSVGMQCVLHAGCPVTVVHPGQVAVAEPVPG